MQIEVIRPFWHDGAAQPVGAVLDLPHGLAMELIGLRKALGVAADQPQAEEVKPARSRKPKAADTTQDPPEGLPE